VVLTNHTQITCNVMHNEWGNTEQIRVGWLRLFRNCQWLVTKLSRPLWLAAAASGTAVCREFLCVLPASSPSPLLHRPDASWIQIIHNYYKQQQLQQQLLLAGLQFAESFSVSFLLLLQILYYTVLTLPEYKLYTTTTSLCASCFFSKSFTTPWPLFRHEIP